MRYFVVEFPASIFQYIRESSPNRVGGKVKDNIVGPGGTSRPCRGRIGLAEFAIGTNRRCRLNIGIREAKKAWGTAHVAIGDNRSIGGVVESSLHIDFILTRPTVWLDGQEVVREGKLLVG